MSQKISYFRYILQMKFILFVFSFYFLQLLKLQMKMQHNSTNFYHYRGLYHSKQLAYFVSSSEGNQMKIKQLQHEINAKMETMTAHLNEVSSIIFQKRQHFLPKITVPTSWCKQMPDNHKPVDNQKLTKFFFYFYLKMNLLLSIMKLLHSVF